MPDQGEGSTSKIPKRKREFVQKQDDLSQKLTGKLHHCLKDVRKVAKKAKAFETQRLVKKLKGIRAKDAKSKEIPDLEAELEILKGTDHEPIASTALKTKIKKDKLLTASEDMTVAVTAELSADIVEPAKPGSPLARVQGRLLSSKALASEVKTIVEMLRLMLQPEKKAAQDPDSDEEAVVTPPSKKQKVVAKASSANEDSEDSDPESRQVIVDEDDAEVDDGGWESGSVDGNDDLGDEDKDPEGDDDSDESSDEDEDGDEDEEEDRPQPRAESAKTKKPAKEPAAVKGKNASESTFLPSLAVGFTRGDSDASDVSDSEAKVADVRKNRRGQRARRMIWEKKYGRNANHVKKQEEVAGTGYRSRERPERGPPNGRNEKHPTNSRPPIANGGSSAPRPSAYPPRPPGGFTPRPSTYASRPPAHDRTIEDKPLHPSWEAKRKQKLKENPGIAPAQGKKIVF